ncbi:hypothetical protein [Streptomyces sp. NPDC057199]|uniref:hypothetical protein n=1 Tax=Streptomyces sp. NPDC057199 TaxID=3346047 RepID=UPI00364272B3
MSLESINWGDAPTWAGAIFAAAAAAFTFITLRSQHQQLDEQRVFIGEQLVNLQAERDALVVAAQDRRSAQARQVTLRTQLVIGPDGPDAADGCYLQAVVSNSSDRPITDVDVEFGDLTADQVQATRVPDHQIVDAPCGIGPRQAYQFASKDSSMDRLEEIAVTTVSTDASGVTWRLTDDNFLSEI